MTQNDIDGLMVRELPEFAKACNLFGTEGVVLCQAAFSIREAELLGAAVKYAGARDKQIIIIP